MKKVFIIDGSRTAIGGQGKSLKNIPAARLASVVIKELVNKNKIKKTSIDEVILGNVVTAGEGQNPARQAAIFAGLPVEINAFTINEVCSSGLKAVISAAQSIMCGDSDIVIAGGAESASLCPYILHKNKKSDVIKLKDMQDSLIADGLWCAFNNAHMGAIAEYTAEKYNVTRQEQDEFALQSHKKACFAQENGLFKNEIVPVSVNTDAFFSIDEKPRKGISLERLAKLPPAFKTNGTVTAGNSSAPADGAAALILASENAIKKFKIIPKAYILSYAAISVDPKEAFTTSGLAIKKCLNACALQMKNVDLFEVNEAFSAQALLAVRLAGLDIKRMNIYGGAIALGHPLGASGARCLATLLNALKNNKEKTGVVSICLGGGSALALAIRMV